MSDVLRLRIHFIQNNGTLLPYHTELITDAIDVVSLIAKNLRVERNTIQIVDIKISIFSIDVSFKLV